MKISKSRLLNLSLVFTVLGLGLVAVSMAQRQLYVDLNNAAQYMEKVQFISTGSNDSAFLEQIGDGSVKIQTNNFILSRTGSDENIISGAYYSSILGGIKNKIEGKGGRNPKGTIIGGSENLINSEYNVILGGKGNQIENGKYSVILGGKNNKLSGDYSVILGSDNTLEGSQSIVVGKSGYVKGNYSAALGTNSKVEANNSFLWTDGSTTETLTGDNLFVIMAGSGMIINNNVAHRFAKLTIGGPLIVSSKNTDENIQCGTGKGGGILKIKNAGSQMCLCSCNGSGRNSMLGKGKCMGICDSSIKPECGNDVQRIKVGNFIEYSGSCIFGKVVKGTGAYLVTKDDKVHWSCQTDDGQTIGCSGTATGYPYRSCGGSHPTVGVIVGSSVYVEVNGIKAWHYTSGSTPGVCEYTCDISNGYHWNGEMCVNTYECIGAQPGENTTGSTVAPIGSNKPWTYKGTGALGACEWRCKSSNYERDGLTMNCKPKTYACTGTQPGANTRHGENTTTNPNQEREYVETNGSLGNCQWSCELGGDYVKVEGENYCTKKAQGICSESHFYCEDGSNSTNNVTGSKEWTWKCGDAECKECREDEGYYKSGSDCVSCNTPMININNITGCKVEYQITPYFNSTLWSAGKYKLYYRKNDGSRNRYYYGINSPNGSLSSIVSNGYNGELSFRIQQVDTGCYSKIVTTGVSTQSCSSSTSCTCANRKTFYDRNCLNWEYDILYSSNRTEIATISTSGVSGSSSNYFGMAATCDSNYYTDTSCNSISSNVCCCRSSNPSECRLSTNGSSPMACPQKYYFFGNSRQLYQTISNKFGYTFAENPTLYIPSTAGQWCRIKLKYTTSGGGTYYVEESTKLGSLQC